MYEYRIHDIDRNKVSYIWARNREDAQEFYIEQCEHYGITHGTLRITRA